MTPALLMSLLLATQNPVQIQLSSMSTATVQVAQEGYLLVLGEARQGQPIVVYPSRPGRSGQVAAGTVKIRSSRAETWVAVWSPLRFDARPFTANTFWSTDSLRRKTLGAIARRMAGDAPIEYAVASPPPPVDLVKIQPFRIRSRATIPGYYDTFLSAPQSWIRQGKFAGGPPDVCNGSRCYLSVWLQLGNMRFGNAP